MNDDTNMPGVDKPAEAVAETAKFGQQVAKIVEAGGEWASAVIGSLPHDVVGILGDTVRLYRYERAVVLREGVVKRLRDRGYKYAENLNAPPSLLLPILEAAVDEDRVDLQNLWEKLLAAASAPDRKRRVRRSYIETIKQLDPADALVLQHVPSWRGVFDWKNWIVEHLSIDWDEASVSVTRLGALGLLDGKGAARKGGGQPEFSGYQLSTGGRLFLKVLED